ncbi:Swt1 family HEPN domain-containing protein [Microbacterium sp. K27]|uniref:Swt1 family HEPN domain-containing protein n=1 Tax=Microbacterium sp. K27 TaxID=2305445 RepID=UPI00109BC0B8|nr:Swt1 family HEPN domain-containing protein [Microbacterium sp. K27]
MTATDLGLQAFLFRSMAINRALAVEEGSPPVKAEDTISRFSAQARAQAAAMGDVYELLYCLENSIRELVESTLKEAHGTGWWDSGVDASIRRSAEKRQEDDEKARWHGPRGDSLLSYVDFPQYGDIIRSQWVYFEPLLGDQGWVTYYFAELNRTRRALAHTGRLTAADVERMEVRVRDWLRVVG